MMKPFIYASVMVSLFGTAQAQDIRVTHCLHGVCPSGGSEVNTLAIHEVYALSNNPRTKLADWVAYRPMRETAASSVDLNRRWRPDPLLSPEDTLEPRGKDGGDDYKRASQTLGLERGHLAPLTLFADTKYWRHTNYYSNIAPMQSSLNRGAWAKLEAQEKNTSYQSRSLYVLTGPLFGDAVSCDPQQRDPSCLPNADEDHAVPVAYWKLVVSRTGSKVSAFIMPQAAPRSASHCDYLSELEVIEAQVGYVLLPSVSPLPQNNLNKELGCLPPYKKTASVTRAIRID